MHGSISSAAQDALLAPGISCKIMCMVQRAQAALHCTQVQAAHAISMTSDKLNVMYVCTKEG